MPTLPSKARQIGWDLLTASAGPDRASLPETFRRLYYHLYTNSDATRAERILEDLSLILLLKLATEVNEESEPVERFVCFHGSANELLLPLLRQHFPDLVDDHQRFRLGDDAVRAALLDLRHVRLVAAPAHIVGEAFQALIGPRLRGDKGQFFTPRSLVRAMVEILAPRPSEVVVDPACGTGGFLIEAYDFQRRQAACEESNARLIGVDKDRDLARLAAALLKVAANGRADVKTFNSLVPQDWLDAFGQPAEHLCDVVLTNPPFGARIGVRDAAILAGYDFGYQWTEARTHQGWHRTATLLSSQDPQLLFLELCVKLLKPGGRLGIVLPEGVFGNKQQGYVWSWLRSQGRISALLDCPRTTFQPGTDTKTNVLFFEKAPHAAEPSRPESEPRARVAVALHCGHDRRGRTQFSNGRAMLDDFSRLGKLYHEEPTNSTDWHAVDLETTDYYVPRYFSVQQPLTAQEADLTRGARLVTVGELIEDGIISMRKGHEVGSDAYGTGDIPFVRTSDLANFEISVDPTKAVSEDVYRRFAPQQQLRPGAILMVVDGRYRIGTTALVTEHNYRCVVQSHLRILRLLNPNVLNAFELLFALNLPSVRMRIRDLVFVQSTLGTLGKRLLELRIPLLHGDGPWLGNVDRFRTALQERSRHLTELAAVNGNEYEL